MQIVSNLKGNTYKYIKYKYGSSYKHYLFLAKFIELEFMQYLKKNGFTWLIGFSREVPPDSFLQRGSPRQVSLVSFPDRFPQKGFSQIDFPRYLSPGRFPRQISLHRIPQMEFTRWNLPDGFPHVGLPHRGFPQIGFPLINLFKIGFPNIGFIYWVLCDRFHLLGSL